MVNLPRLSQSLRSGSILELQESSISTFESDVLHRNTHLDLNFTWTSLVNHFRTCCKEDCKQLAHEQLRQVWTLVREGMGYDEYADIVDHSAVYMLHLFLKTKVVTKQHLSDIQTTFGTILHSNILKIFTTVEKLKLYLIDDAQFLCWLDDNILKNKFFGMNLSISVPSIPGHDIHLLQDLRPNVENSKKVGSYLSMKYKEEHIELHVSTPSEIQSWVRKNLNSDDEKQLHQIIKSDLSDIQIQDGLYKIFKGNHLDVLEAILKCRLNYCQYIDMIEAKLSRIRYTPKPEIRPIIAATVVVQSEMEKMLKKQARKDEKKINRLQNGKNLDNQQDELIDPLLLRLHRHEELLRNAHYQPILTKKTDVGVPTNSVKFPYVFDMQNTIKSHAGFVGGQRIALPYNSRRLDNKEFEEVSIPAMQDVKLNVGNNFIKIDTLDDIAKLAFANTKELNRIQSIVFPVAYQSNENMLVCAPTGAGKTNVAMLAIVRTLRSHMVAETINRNAFKIVYIAPMKALATEMVDNFSKRLKSLSIVVRELTGDMQLTKYEMQETQILVSTPEKWDVVTRKGAGDVALLSLVKLIIIDEVHLLHGDRGPVVEALVARTLRLVESTQSMIRIVGLSATLPNYLDVARFLRVNPMKGLFFFDSRFRPVPLDTNFIGVKAVKTLQQLADTDKICYDKCVEMLLEGHQIMIFVHARNATARLGTVLRDLAQQKGQLSLFVPTSSVAYSIAKKTMSSSRNKQLVDLFESGIGVHHAGMLRADRSHVEHFFADGFIRVLICTSTLAWGVNLPAHAVFIRGTEIYSSKQGSYTDLGILDVLQIFGRAGRPQFDKSGVATIITSHDKLNHYLSLLTNQFPIESNFVTCLSDNLNAEITLGTISNIEEAIEWLSYTYLYVRMRVNPHVYGIEYSEVENDPYLLERRRQLITSAAVNLDKAKMIRFNQRTGDLNITDLGRTASHFYIKYDTVEIFNELIKPFMNESDIFSMISQSQEFEQLKVRDEEIDELDFLKKEYTNVYCFGGSENVHSKVNILMQTHLSRGFIRSFSLISDLSYVVPNVSRIARALFTIAIRNNMAVLAGRMLNICTMFEKQIWNFECPLRQFQCIPPDIIEKIESRGLSVYAIREMTINEVKDILRNQKYGTMVLKCANEFPCYEIIAKIQPITRTVVKIKMSITPSFKWNDKVHGKQSQGIWVWIEDPENNMIYHSDYISVSRKNVYNNISIDHVVTIPLKEPIPSQYYIRIVSDSWVGSSESAALNFTNLVLPENHPPLTELLPLQPLPVTAIGNKKFETLYNFEHFNPIQTQVFHCLYHTDNNVLVGAPTGSGKTIMAEIAILRLFQTIPKFKVVYIAPLKALVKERIKDWKQKFGVNLNKTVVELTGDVTPDISAIRKSEIIITTPEKWDGISRSWQTREYVRDVGLIIIDEIHLLGEERGPVLEVIISRNNFISSHTKRQIRIVGLSTALSNAQDLANWMGIKKTGMYNFKPSVRPVPLSVHINGFSGKHYCPRMAKMNKSVYQAIRLYSAETPALVFVSSRRQTRLTATDLITFLAADSNPKQFLQTTEDDMQQIMKNIRDTDLKLLLAFGIGIHHAGLQEHDRKQVEELFLNRKIQILVATSTLAWGVNLPAHLVIVKGTEYFDGKLKKYVDMPITDVLQMMGRAGRPQFDDEAIAVVFVHDVKKDFYKKFLYDPFPVESSLLGVLPDHINAEIVAGTVTSKQSILDYLTWTFFYRRLLRNPSFYNLEDFKTENINLFLSQLVDSILMQLLQSGCVFHNDDVFYPTSMGRISSFYYISHQTISHFVHHIRFEMTYEDILKVLSDCYEFEQHPVRHNEDIHNEELANECRFRPDRLTYDSPHTKTFLLLQAHLSRLKLPNSDYFTDTKSVLDQAIRLIQAMIDVSAENGWLRTTLKIQQVMQSIIQAIWIDDVWLMILPHVNETNYDVFGKIKQSSDIVSLVELKVLAESDYDSFSDLLRKKFSEIQIEEIFKVLQCFPLLSLEIYINGADIRATRIENTANSWITVSKSQEYSITIRMDRTGKISNNIYCPKFAKGKNEAWFLTIGCKNNDELLALKRVNTKSNKTNIQMSFNSPNIPGKIIYTLYLISDGMLCLDQQYDMRLNVID